MTATDAPEGGVGALVELPGAFFWRGLSAGVWHAGGERQHFYCEPEQALLVIGPPRSRKTSSVVVPNLWHAPGAAVSTSTKPDVLEATVAVRAQVGTCWVFDPTGSTPLPEGATELRWSPLVSADSWDGAVSMARALVRAARPYASTHPEAQHWVDRAEALLAPLLHAAAASGRTIAEVCDWTLTHDVREPEAILSRLGAKLAKVALASVWRTEERERSGIFSTAAGLLAVYRSSVALEPARLPNFDPHRFVSSRDTVYVCAPGSAQDQLAPLVVALLEQIRDACYLRRRRHPDAAPTLFLLDEVANIAPLPGLAQLVSEGGGQGVVTLACLQDLSQARARWGQAAEGFFSLFGAKVIFPGVADRRTLELVSALAGEQEVLTRSVSQPQVNSRWDILFNALAKPEARRDLHPTVTTSAIFRPRLPVDDVYRGRPGQALAIAGTQIGWIPLEPYWGLRDLEADACACAQVGGDYLAEGNHWPPSPFSTLGPRILSGQQGPGVQVVGGTKPPESPLGARRALEASSDSDERDAPVTAETEREAQRAAPVVLGPADECALHGYSAVLKVVGPPELVGGAEPLGPSKSLELACVLALHQHRPMSGEELLGALWPGELGEATVAAKSLRNTASVLRKALGTELFPEARKGLGYQLAAEVGCDATIIAELLSQAKAEEEGPCLRQALALVRGAPFEGVKRGAYTWAWSEHLVSVIERNVRSAAYRLCELVLETGDHEQASWGALQALMVDPYDRKLWELYLTACAGSGRRALEQGWREAQGVLGRDSSDLVRLVERLRRGDGRR